MDQLPETRVDLSPELPRGCHESRISDLSPEELPPPALVTWTDSSQLSGDRESEGESRYKTVILLPVVLFIENLNRKNAIFKGLIHLHPCQD